MAVTTDIFRIVYCSRNTLDPETALHSIDQILASSRRNNQAAGVTGALLYNEGVFVQVLEGEFGAVQTVFERIQCDERHDQVVVLQANTVAAPMFTEWAMAFAEPQDKRAASLAITSAVADLDDRACERVLDLLDTLVRYEPVVID